MRPMKGVTIREATEADDRAIGDLLVRAFVEKYATKMPEVKVTERRIAELRDVANKRACAKVWVAERNGQVLGTVALWLKDSKGSESWIPTACDLRHLAVDSAERGQGTSAALLETAEQCARHSGASAVVLHVRRGAVGVRRLYEARGYRRDESGDLDLRPEVYLEAFVLPFSPQQ
jgi:predicted N-acetyltransferase YhbS